jgi:excisionase family DNA binding protein
LKRTGPSRDSKGGYVSTLTAARLCGVSVFSIQRWFDDGLLTGATLPGGRRRISESSLEQFMRRHALLPDARATGDGHRILLVDDDARLLSVMREGLAREGGFTVRTATSGLEAGLAVADFRPSAIVLDVLLEDLPGPAVVRRLRESEAGRTVRIVAISGKASDAAIRETLAAGANAFLRKPFTVAELVRAIRLRRTVRP